MKSSDEYFSPPSRSVIADGDEQFREVEHYHDCLSQHEQQYLEVPEQVQYHQQQQQQQHHAQLSPYLEYFIDDRDGDPYFEDDFDDDGSGPAVISKREKLERLFDGHKIRTPFDTFAFLLRFLLFILLLTKYTLITTLVIQGRLYEYVNHETITDTKLILITVTYFVLTMVFLLMIPVPDNRCGCHFFIIMSLTAFSSIELLFNQNNSVLKLTTDLSVATLSVTILSLSYFICLWFKLILAMMSKSIRAMKRSAHKSQLQSNSDLNML